MSFRSPSAGQAFVPPEPEDREGARPGDSRIGSSARRCDSSVRLCPTTASTGRPNSGAAPAVWAPVMPVVGRLESCVAAVSAEHASLVQVLFGMHSGA